MTREDAEAFLTKAGNRDDAAFPLFEAAIACSIHEAPSRDPEQARSFAEEAAQRLAQRLKSESPEEALAETMNWPPPCAGRTNEYINQASAGPHRPIV